MRGFDLKNPQFDRKLDLTSTCTHTDQAQLLLLLLEIRESQEIRQWERKFITKKTSAI